MNRNSCILLISSLTALSLAVASCGGGQPTITSTSGQPTVTSTSGQRIVVACWGDSDLEICTMNTDGSEQICLTNSPGDDLNPAWSPDGKRIAFASPRDDPDSRPCRQGLERVDNCNWEIYVMNADGSEQTRLTHNEGVDFNPAWSPDGKRIAFASDRDGDLEIYVMNADGSEQTRLTHNEGVDFNPAWSPDGMSIAFASERSPSGFTGIHVMNADGSEVTRLTLSSAPDSSPTWSPDGTRIAFQDGSRTCIMNADVSGEIICLTDRDDKDAEPAWSP